MRKIKKEMSTKTLSLTIEYNGEYCSDNCRFLTLPVNKDNENNVCFCNGIWHCNLFDSPLVTFSCKSTYARCPKCIEITKKEKS